MSNKKSDLSQDECEELILSFYKKRDKFNAIKNSFELYKNVVDEELTNYFEDNNLSKLVVNNFYNEEIVVNRIQKSSVEFDANKLEKVLGKSFKNVIISKYEINDITGLINYLKSCNVNPNIFKSFLNISKSVNIKELEKLEELGKVSLDKLKDCYVIKHQQPYFTVKMKRGQSDGGYKG